MSDQNTTGTDQPVATAVALEMAGPKEPRVDLPTTLDLNQLQTLAPSELDELCRRCDVRVHAGRTRHHQIVDLIRWGLGRNLRVTAAGFFDQLNDGFALLRWPALNFLPVPEDVAVPRAVVQRFRLRPGQAIAGTLRFPRDREKGIMLDEVLTIEGVPVQDWTELTAFDNLTPQYPEGRIFLENPEAKAKKPRTRRAKPKADEPPADRAHLASLPASRCVGL